MSSVIEISQLAVTFCFRTFFLVVTGQLCMKLLLCSCRQPLNISSIESKIIFQHVKFTLHKSAASIMPYKVAKRLRYNTPLDAPLVPYQRPVVMFSRLAFPALIHH
jgi:hypothetical protein